MLLHCLLLVLLIQFVRNDEVKWIHSYSNESPVQACARVTGKHIQLTLVYDLTYDSFYTTGGNYIPSLDLVDWNQPIFQNTVENVLNKTILSYAAGKVYLLTHSLTHSLTHLLTQSYRTKWHRHVH